MGAGLKNFGSEVLTSDDVDNYLMKQTVMVFADATALEASLTAAGVPAEEGMHAYLRGTDSVYVFDGANWRIVYTMISAKGTLLVADGVEVSTLPLGTDTYVLTADSAQPVGVKWAALPGGDNIQGKATAGSASQESVTWTSAFGSTPIVVASAVQVGGTAYANVRSRSTTAAEVVSYSDAGAALSVVKQVIAREPT